MPTDGNASPHPTYRFLPIVAGVVGALPAGIIHRGFGVGPYPSLVVGGFVAFAIFMYGSRRMDQSDHWVRA